ncbi:YciI family protein [Salinisphaera aquimarina]|uniref:YciI family protein n=1 Tax=Salinisphaera aquimarina TaxID=2094031 RepID=A0ABV7EW46_9GAMM
MDYFAIVSFDVAESSDGRAKAGKEHRARLEQLSEEGRLLTAGPLPREDAYGKVIDGFQGSIIVAQFDSLEDARAWAKVDPYNAEGVYMETTVYPYKKVF